MFKGNVTAIPMPVASNSGEAFSKMRKHGADGSIPQAYGGSSLSDWLGDSVWDTERMTAGRANGMFAPEVISKSKQITFDIGHDFEDAIALHNVKIMSVESGIQVLLHDASQEEFRNDAWPSMAAHLDFWIQVVKGEIIPNPAFVVGGPEKNYKIVPSADDHWYIADSKSVQSRFRPNWMEKDENGLPIGGMKYGICPTHYRQQMLGYMATCKVEGAVILAACGFERDDFAQIFVPYDKEEAEAIMDEVERRNYESYKGIIPSVADCKNVALAIAELPLQYPDTNRDKKILSLDPAKWGAKINRIKEIDDELKKLEAVIKPAEDALKEQLKKEKKAVEELKAEKSKLLMLPLEEVQDGPGCTYIDPDSGDVVTIAYGCGIKWDKSPKTALADDYPEVFDDLRRRFPERKPTYKRQSSDKSNRH